MEEINADILMDTRTDVSGHANAPTGSAGPRLCRQVWLCGHCRSCFLTSVLSLPAGCGESSRGQGTQANP